MDQSSGGHSNPPCGFCGRATVAISFAAVPAGFCTCNVCLHDLAGVLGYRCPLCNFTIHRQGCCPHHPPPPPPVIPPAYMHQHQPPPALALSYAHHDQSPVASPDSSGSRRMRVRTFFTKMDATMQVGLTRLVQKVISPLKNGGGGRKKKGKGGGEEEEEEGEGEEEDDEEEDDE